MSPHSPSPAAARPPSQARPLLLSNALDAAGRQGADFAIDVLAVVLLGASAAQMGLLNALGTLAFLVLGIPIGVLVDRSPTVRLLTGSGLARAALLSTLIAAWALDGLTMAHLYLVAALVGVSTVVTETTQTTIAPRIAANASQAVARLVSRMQSAESVVGLVVPALAGVAVAAVGAGPALSVATALTVAAALVVSTLRLPALGADEGTTADGDVPADPPASAVAASALGRFAAEAREGWSTLRSIRTLWRLTIASMLVNLGLAAHSAIEIVLALRVLEVGPQTLGVIFSLGALGALLGSMIAVPISERCGAAVTLRGSMLLLAPTAVLTLVAVLDPTRAPIWLMASAFGWGVTIVVYNVVNAGLSAQITPAPVMGRVSATRRTLAMGVVPAGSLAGGLIADHLGMAHAIAVWIGLNLAAALLVALTRDLDSPGRSSST